MAAQRGARLYSGLNGQGNTVVVIFLGDSLWTYGNWTGFGSVAFAHFISLSFLFTSFTNIQSYLLFSFSHLFPFYHLLFIVWLIYGYRSLFHLISVVSFCFLSFYFISFSFPFSCLVFPLLLSFHIFLLLINFFSCLVLIFIYIPLFSLWSIFHCPDIIFFFFLFLLPLHLCCCVLLCPFVSFMFLLFFSFFLMYLFYFPISCNVFPTFLPFLSFLILSFPFLSLH